MATFDIEVDGKVTKTAILDSNNKVPLEHLPSFMPQRARAWRNVKASKVVGQYYIVGDNDTYLHIRAAASQSTERYLHLYIRENNSAPVFDIRSDVFGAAGYRWCQISTIVPAGWQYAINTSGGSTTANIEFWYECS